MPNFIFSVPERCRHICARGVTSIANQSSQFPRAYLLLKELRNRLRSGRGWEEIRRLKRRGDVPGQYRPIRQVDLEHDLPFPGKVRNNIILCSSGRSGSSLVCRLMSGTSLLGAPGEYFGLTLAQRFTQDRFEASNTKDYIAKLQQIRTTSNGVFASKLHYFQYVQMFGNVSLENFFPNVKHLYLYRKDLVAQAVSFAKAMTSRQYVSVAQACDEPRYDEALIRRCYLDLVWENRGWKRYFERWGIQPLVLEYEQDSKDFQRLLEKILSYAEIELPPNFKVPDPRIGKMSDRVSEQWIERIRPKLPKVPAEIDPATWANEQRSSVKR